MYSTALLPTDLSPASDRVVGCALCLPAFGVRSIVLLHALGLRHLEDMAPGLEAAVEPHLRAQARALERTGVPVELLVVPGVAHKEIARVARERRAPLVLLGSLGASLAHEARIGTVSLETLHGCEAPLLVARGRACAASADLDEAPALPRRVLHPTDFSDAGERAFSHVLGLVRMGVEAVSLLHVQDRTHQGHGTDQALEPDQLDRGRLERLAASLRRAGACYVQVELARGSPTQEILRQASEIWDCLVVMGTRGRGVIPEAFLGSVSHAVARQAVAPVLLVPPGAVIR